MLIRTLQELRLLKVEYELNLYTIIHQDTRACASQLHE